jgi:hypothetical protein
MKVCDLEKCVVLWKGLDQEKINIFSIWFLKK